MNFNSRGEYGGWNTEGPLSGTDGEDVGSCPWGHHSCHGEETYRRSEVSATEVLRCREHLGYTWGRLANRWRSTAKLMHGHASPGCKCVQLSSFYCCYISYSNSILIKNIAIILLSLTYCFKSTPVQFGIILLFLLEEEFV